jgi:anaerobic magnesium-protoporphyrin IX monomethyl ester cyclase
VKSEQMHETVTLCSAVRSDEIPAEPPLGPLYIAAALEAMGVEIDFRDLQLMAGAHGFSGEPLTEFLAGHADIVAISCFVDMLPAVLDATRRLHADRPETRFLLGGPGPTASARRILEEYPWVTGVVRGEGEEAAQDWIRVLRGERRGPVPGMVYRDAAGAIVDGPERARNRALDELPLPAYHLINWSDYDHARLITTRGCSYRCSFCDVTALWGNRSVFRGLHSTVDEIETLRDISGKSLISIVDDTFVLNRERVREFSQMLIDRRSGVTWGCFGRINLMTPALVDKMAESGCRAIFYGIDSGSQPVLDRTVKHVRRQDVMPVLKLSAQYFERIEASFIWGYPFETLDDFERTLELAAEASMLAPKVNVQLHMLSPLPLSPLYREFDGGLIEPQECDRRWLLLPPLLLEPAASVVADFVRRAPDIHPGFYSFPTPAKEAKIERLENVRRGFDRTVGSAVFDARVADLANVANDALEQNLLGGPMTATDRIGVGLGLGYFAGIRRGKAKDPVMSRA